MSKFISSYVCQQCGYKSSQYLGKCPQCDSWNSFVEEVEESRQSSALSRQTRNKAQIINLSDVKQVHYKRLTTGISEFDRCLGGGIVLGSVNLVSGDPGIGKSTLLTQLALNINSIDNGPASPAKRGEQLTMDKEISNLKSQMSNVLYVAGEESASQIKIRVDRMTHPSFGGKKDASLQVINEVDVDVVIEAIKSVKPNLVIIDSIQTLETQDLESIAGSIGQVRECALRLQRMAKELHIPIFLVGHVTKEGNLAGPKTLEHLVDVVLSLEGEANNFFRILRASKNRFGPTDEVGIFEMDEFGMSEVKNPSKLFLDNKINAPGSAVAGILTGIRPLMVEIQALVTKTGLPSPRRTGSGVDNNRLQLLVAVLQKRLGLPLYDQDIFVNVTGGIKVFEPSADLGICMSMISSYKDLSLLEKTAFIGEVGLLGELRMVRDLEKRVAEASKLGFTNIISAKNAKTLSDAVRLSFKTK